jgi:hypothetical protein
MDDVRSDYGSKLANSCNPWPLMCSPLVRVTARMRKRPASNLRRAPTVLAVGNPRVNSFGTWCAKVAFAGERMTSTNRTLPAYINHVARSAAGGCPVVLAHGSRAISEDDPTVTRQRPQSEIRFMEDLHCLLPGPLPTERILGRTLAIGMCLGCTAVRKEYRKHLIFGVI